MVWKVENIQSFTKTIIWTKSNYYGQHYLRDRSDDSIDDPRQIFIIVCNIFHSLVN